MQYLLISLAIGIVFTALLVLVFLKVGVKPQTELEKEDELVRSCGDEGLIALYEQARSDAERSDIVAFVKEKLAVEQRSVPTDAAVEDNEDTTADVAAENYEDTTADMAVEDYQDTAAGLAAEVNEDTAADMSEPSLEMAAAAETIYEEAEEALPPFTVPETEPQPVAGPPQQQPITLEQFIAAQFAEMHDSTTAQQQPAAYFQAGPEQEASPQDLPVVDWPEQTTPDAEAAAATGLAAVFAGSAMQGLAGEAQAQAETEAEINSGVIPQTVIERGDDQETRVLPLDEVDWSAIEAELERKREEAANIMAQNVHIQEVFAKVKDIEGQILHNQQQER